jgi:hypothetical protein
MVVLNDGLKRREVKPLQIMRRHYKYGSIFLKKTVKILSQVPGLAPDVCRRGNAVFIPLIGSAGRIAKLIVVR